MICDKDGISAASVFLEMASFLNVTRGITVVQHLQELYEKYGQFVSYNSYVISKDIRVTDRIFANLRPNDTNPKYWASCAGVDVVAIKDATTGYDSTGASTLPVTPDTHMIMYEFANGVSVTLRTSGTEPKIKYYTEIAGKPGQGRAQVEQVLHEFVDKLVDEMLQPEANGLQRA